MKTLLSEVSSIYDEVEDTRSAVATITEQQSTRAREQFESLATKCREELGQASEEKAAIVQHLDKAKRSLAKVQIEVEVLRAKNLKLQSQKSVVADDVNQLRSDIARLEDQKKILERQLSQNEKMATEKDKTVKELEEDKKKLKSQLQSKEKTWKTQFARQERDWEDRMAEMEQIQGNIEEEKDDLLHEKNAIEERLADVEADKGVLEKEKSELEDKVTELESQITEMEGRLSENAAEMDRVQKDIAQVVVEHACNLAKVRMSSQLKEQEFAASESEMRIKMAALVEERDRLTERLEDSQTSRKEIEALEKGTSEKDDKIQDLTAQLDSLKTENESIATEIKSLRELHQSAVDNLQQHLEAKESLQLDNQKIHMTLRTEISLLQTKLKTTEEEKLSLETKVSQLMAASSMASSSVKGERAGEGKSGGAGGFREGEEAREYVGSETTESREKKVRKTANM